MKVGEKAMADRVCRRWQFDPEASHMLLLRRLGCIVLHLSSLLQSSLLENSGSTAQQFVHFLVLINC